MVANSLFWGSFFLAAVHMGQVKGFLCYSLSATFYLYTNGKVFVIPLKIRALRMRPFCTFQALGTILLQKELDQHDSAEATEHTRVRDRNKEEIQYGIKFVLYTGPQVVFVGGIEA